VIVKHIIKEPNCLAEISGNNVQTLYNYLQNEEGELTLIGTSAYINAQLKCLSTMENGEIQIINDFSQSSYTKLHRWKL
jgi:hypothetical protein